MIFVLAVATVLVVSFLCSIAEASLLSLSPDKIARVTETGGRSGEFLAHLRQNVNRPIAAILILNTIAHTAGASVAGAEYESLFGEGSIAIFSAVFTVAVLVVTEIIPKSLGVSHAKWIGLRMAIPLAFIVKLLWPLVWASSQLTRLLGSGSHKQSFGVQDLMATIRMARAKDLIGETQETIFASAARLEKKTVEDVMIHRPDIVYVSLDESVEENVTRMRRSLHSRFPVGRPGLDDIIGYVTQKELSWRLTELEEKELSFERLVAECLEEILFVEKDTSLTSLISDFADQHAHIAIVREEERTIGFVTLEDVIEELLGEIDDEYDAEPDRIRSLEGNRYRFGGGVSCEDVAETLGLTMEELLPDGVDISDDSVALHEYFHAHLPGRVRTGAFLDVDGWRLSIRRVRRGKVHRVDAQRRSD